MKTMIKLFALFLSVCILCLPGCSGKTKPVIPKDLPNIDSSTARVIITRERQVSGAAATIAMIDIGTAIESNAMLAVKDLSVEAIREGRDVASLGVFIDVMWYHPGLLPSFKWNPDGSTGFMFGNLAVVTPECDFYPTAMGMAPASILTDECVVEKALNLNGYFEIDMDPLWQNQTERIDLVKAFECIQKGLIMPYGHVLEGFKDPCLGGDVYVFTDPAAGVGDYFSMPAQEDGTLYPQYISMTKDDIRHIVDNRKISRNIHIIGTVNIGETLIYDRKPGLLMLGSVWHDGAVGFMSESLELEAGKTYYLHYTTRIGKRWKLTNVE